MSNYLEYLEESTNTVKSKNKLAFSILMATYNGIWILSIILFYSGIFGPTDGMLYSLLIFYFILPVTMLTVSLTIGKNNYMETGKWWMVILLGLTYTFVDYATFKTANAQSIRDLGMPNITLFFNGVIISAIGLIIGMKKKNRKDKKAKSVQE